MMKKVFKKVVQFYLKILTRIIIWRKSPLIIAIAGTTNKTFIKDRILKELDTQKNLIRGNPRSFNTEIGLPLAVLFLPSGYSSVFKWVDVLLSGTVISFFGRNFPRVLVLEMGVSKKGDMKYLLSMIRPKIALITNVDENFPDYEINSKEMIGEMEVLAKVLPRDGLLVLNADDERLEDLKKISKAKSVLYGTKNYCHAKIKNIERVEQGQVFDFEYQGKTQSLSTDKYGKHNVYSLAAAKVIVEYLNKKIFLKK